MNPEQLLSEVEKLLKERESSPNDRWALVVRHQKIQCLPTEKLGIFEIVIINLNREQCEHGLMASTWNRIKQKISLYQKAGKL